MNSIPNTSQYSNFIYYNEIFVPITNEMVEGIKPYYTISNYGRVYSSYSDTFIIPHENENGYLQVSLMTETGRVFRKVHRLVMMAFGPKPGPGQTQVNHMYGNKLDNYFANLEWSTPKENVNHAIQYGLRESFAGNNNPNSSISENDARKIYDLLRVF